MKYIGYSTGAIALGDYSHALDLLAAYEFAAVELSALRINEVEPLVQAVPGLDLHSYKYVSFHAPSAFAEHEEERLISLLMQLPPTWPIVLHPDAIHRVERWFPLASRLAIENMDRRKNTGRTASELRDFFALLPGSKMCLDLGHARQVDSSMVAAYLLLTEYADRIVQLHVSEVDTFNRHEAISRAAEWAFLQVQRFIPNDVAIILESRVTKLTIRAEADKVINMFGSRTPTWRSQTAVSG